MAKLGGKVIAALAAGAAVVALVAGAWFAGWGPFAREAVAPSPSPTPSSTSSPNPSPTPPPAFVERQVTVAPHVPDARAPHGGRARVGGTGWVVAIYDATAIDDAGVESPGPRVLYLISPDGIRYELANLDTLGMGTPDLVAWDTRQEQGARWSTTSRT